MVPKYNKGVRFLGIPSMYDRALQVLFVYALEPEFEAVFESEIYGFRPGRSAMDAIKQIHICCSSSEKFVLHADIKKCFDCFNYEKLLNLVGHKGKVRKQIKAWVTSGNIFEGKFIKPKQGFPQGNLISPLLSNIMLNGLQKKIEDWAETQKLLRPNGMVIKSLKERRKAVHYVYYAGDVIVMHRELSVVESCEKITEEFLSERGLELNSLKTKILHTRKLYKGNKAGFKYLGFTIKHFDSIHRSALNSKKEKVGYKLLIYPSENSIASHFYAVEKCLKKLRTWKQVSVINKLNPIIVGWVNYFKYSHFLTTSIASRMDRVLFLKLMTRAKRKLSAKTYGPGYKKFWRKVDGKLGFAAFIAENGSHVKISSYRKTAKSVSINKYTKVLGESSVYDCNFDYWAKRALPPELRTKRRIVLMLEQKGKCAICSATFKPEDIIEIDHIIPRVKGGKHNVQNLQLLHAHCHDYKVDPI
jgi:RNA-directed DNA polymerase